MPTAAAALVLAVISGVVTYERVTTPKQTVRLAVLPFETDAETAALAPALLRDMATQLGTLKGNAQTKFVFAGGNHGATHVLRGTLAGRNGRVLLHVYVTNARSQSNAMDWQAEYAPQELRYAPVALAGVVTLTFHLPALAANVNQAAQRDYFPGLSLTRRDSTIDQALPLLERAVAADSDSPLTYAALAEAQWFKYYATKDQAWLDRFANSVREAEMRDPDLPEVHRVAGLLKANSGLYEAAATEYLRAIDLQPKNGDAYRRLGLVYESSSLLDKALDEYRLAAEVDPQQYRNQQALGAFYYQRARYEEAVPYLRKLVELAPQEPNAHYALGSVYMTLGQFAEAAHELDVSLGLGESPTALHHRALVLMYQRRDAEAIPYLLRGLSLWPDHFKLWMQLGNAYANINRRGDAGRAFHKALDGAARELEHDPRNGNTRAFRAYLFAKIGDTQTAASEAVQAMQLSPEDIDGRLVVAETYQVMGKPDEAIAVLRGSPEGLIADFARWPEVANLVKDPHFVELLHSRQSH